MATAKRAALHTQCGPLICAGVLVAASGCAQRARTTVEVPRQPRVLVIAPVLNLSGSQDFDALKVTDLIASEFLTFSDVAVVPVNLTLAELERQGKYAIETPEDAIALARALGADATIVVAVTEYNPYSPPVLGLLMQWYAARPAAETTPGTDVAADSSAELLDVQRVRPRWQVQRVFNAADEELLEEIRAYARQRDGHESPYGWRKYTRSQELYVRCCSHALIMSMLGLDDGNRTANAPHEAEL
jgi:hypothetical protein